MIKKIILKANYFRKLSSDEEVKEILQQTIYVLKNISP